LAPRLVPRNSSQKLKSPQIDIQLGNGHRGNIEKRERESIQYSKPGNAD
jgi:hypothetical protein